MLMGFGLPYTVLIIKNGGGVEVWIELMIVNNEFLIKNV
jgi:hypothetical protein